MGRLTEAVVCLVLFLAIARDTEGISCRQPGINIWQRCYGLSSLCCRSISYSRSYYGTTFSSCCTYSWRFTSERSGYCTNSYAAQLFCTKSSNHCCPSAITTNGKYYRGCCSIQTSSSVCSSDKGAYGRQICNGVSTQCCPHKSYWRSNIGTTFRSCCDSDQYNHPSVNFCSKSNYREYCSDRSHTCCSSATLRSGKWERGCCSLKASVCSSDNGADGRQICSGVSTYCCPHKSYWRSTIGTTFRSCCDSDQYNHPSVYLCSNSNYEEYCSDSGLCCSSAKLRNGKWERGCCSTKTDNGGGSIGWSVDRIIGGAIGGIVILVVISVIIGVRRRKRYANRANTTNMTIIYDRRGSPQQQQQGYPQQPGVQHPPPAGPMGYPVQGGPFVVGSQPGPQVGFQGQHLPMGANQQTAQGAPPPAYHLAAHGPPSGGPPPEYHTVAQGASPDNQPT